MEPASLQSIDPRLRAALALQPDHPRSANNLGIVYLQQGDLDTAAALFRRALALRPAYPQALTNFGSVLRLLGDFDGAIQYCQRSLALCPDNLEALNNLGNALSDARRFEEAIAAFQRALRLQPQNGNVHANLSIPLLASGRFQEGWRELEWRWKTAQLRGARRAFAQPPWRGEAGHGRTLLIHAEQGFGDTLQFCRYAPEARDRGFRVVMEAPRKLRRILQSLDGVEPVVARGDPLPRFDVHCPVMSLPGIFHTTAETIPAELPYLSAHAADQSAWQARVAAVAGDALRVGLVWAGQPRGTLPGLIAADRRRSFAPETLAPLLDVAGVRFFSLQKDGSRFPDASGVIDWMADCRDFADTAALVANLDLVISVDTAVAHLAGALGKPVWLLNRFDSCWRWLHGRDDSPWYPGVLRIFGQPRPGRWDIVARRVRDALAAEPRPPISRPSNPATAPESEARPPHRAAFRDS